MVTIAFFPRKMGIIGVLIFLFVCLYTLPVVLSFYRHHSHQCKKQQFDPNSSKDLEKVLLFFLFPISCLGNKNVNFFENIS